VIVEQPTATDMHEVDTKVSCFVRKGAIGLSLKSLSKKKIELNVAYNVRHSYVASADSLFCLFGLFIMAFNQFLRQTVLLLGIYALTVLSLLKNWC